MNHSAVIFDFDGTITRPIIDFAAIRAEIGGVDGPILEAIKEWDTASRERAMAILERYEWQAARNATLQEGAVDVLASLRKRGYPVAILTRNARVTLEHVLDRFSIVVDAIRTREDAAIKPSPEPVFSICEELSADPHRSWIVGDYLFDILSGKAAETRTVLMIGDRERPDYADQADHVITRLTDLPAIIEAERASQA